MRNKLSQKLEDGRVRSGAYSSEPGEPYGGFLIYGPGGRRLKIIATDGVQWKAIGGYGGLYEVSNTGLVKARAKRIGLPNNGFRDHPEIILKPESMEKGYHRVMLCDGHRGDEKKVLVHVLVADAFIPRDENMPQVNHRDGVKSNNCLGNLERCTAEYNLWHAMELGLGRYKNEWDRELPPPPLRCNPVDVPWEHVSVSTEKHPPNWEEMSYVKALFWEDEEAVMQLHPAKSEYVNCHPNCLHLWRPVGAIIPLPPSLLVGPKT